MLARNGYPKEYVDQARFKMQGAVKAWQSLAQVTPAEQRDAFEPGYFNTLLLALEAHFVHRTRKQEGKDGYVLKEVRVLAEAVMEHMGVVPPEAQGRYDPAQSVLGLKPGDKVDLREADFVRLSDAFLTELVARFPPD